VFASNAAWRRRAREAALCGVLSLSAAASMGACAGTTGQPAQDELVLDAATCAQAPSWWECVRALELELLDRAPNVRRAGDSLFITPAAGRVVALVDEVDEHDVGHHYLYTGFSTPLDAHLVVVQFYEGSSMLLVARATGAATPLDALPVPSPDSERIVTTSWDTEAGYVANRIQILRRSGDAFALEWQLEPESWGPDEPRWLDDSTVVVLRRPAIWHTDSLQLRAPLVLRRTDAGWTADSSQRR
jgi:hypothetical protein